MNVVPSELLASPTQVMAAVTNDPRFAGVTVRYNGTDYLELDVTSLAPRARAGRVYAVLAWPALWSSPERLEPHVVRARSGNYALLLVGDDADFADDVGEQTLTIHVRDETVDVTSLMIPTTTARIIAVLRACAESGALRQAGATLELELERARHENEMLISIGRALSDERDLDRLLGKILQQAREITGADAGSVYIVDNQDEDVAARSLRFMISQNDSREVEPSGFTMKVSSASIVGTAVLSSDVVNIPDLYRMAPPGTSQNPWGFIHDRSFDDKYRYQTRSMLTVPMISARDQVIGVIQLINKRANSCLELNEPGDFDTGVVPFDDVSVSYATALASQAGIALENAMLHAEVRELFDGFVKASVTAIESRDPTTSGHSERVAELTVNLAKVVDGIDEGELADIKFSRDELTAIEYAGLLHDFGKVGVREHVLVKAKKLYEHQRDLVIERFRYIRRGIQVEDLERQVRMLSGLPPPKDAGHADLGARLAELDEMVEFILAANEPTVLEQGGFERIAEIANHKYCSDDGASHPFLLPVEAEALQIRRGSLTEVERDEINRHVVHTYNFLNAIPWGRTLRGIPEIAGAHHERLDGTGYPGHRLAGDIPIAARMMAIADIYDALTASDRPYKKAIPAERALSILDSEVQKGMLDATLFKVFSEARLYAGPGRR